MSLRQELIDFYGGGKVEEVENSADYDQLRAKYRADEGFEPERLRIRQFRKNLADLCAGQTHPAQVRLCLRLLGGEKDADNRSDYHNLICLGYRPHWSDPQKTHFDDAYAILTGDMYFFLSFTTRSNTPSFVSSVNRENRYFLEDAFWPDDPSKLGNLARENMLAAAVWRYLKDHGLPGFYFPEHAGTSNDVRKNLRGKSEKMLTFVQLVQGVMFDHKDPNFCHFEYEQAQQSPTCRKRIYILGEDRANIHARNNTLSNIYRPWFDEILDAKDALELISTRYRDDEAVKKNHDELKKKVVRQIERIRDDLFEKVPAT